MEREHMEKEERADKKGMDEKGMEEKSRKKGQEKKPLGIYLHIPFCVRKCNYCDFLSAPAADSVKARYVEALCREIEAQAPLYHEHEVKTVFFGGGTPSLLEGGQVALLLERLSACFSFGQEEPEISLEANPGTVDGEKLAVYRKAGVNRLSFGLQSVREEELRLLGRIHTWKDFLESYQAARKAGFTNINVDLMSALPGQSVDKWMESLKKVVGLEPEHISAYSLIVEAGTPFAQRELKLPGEDEEYQMYEDTADILKRYGFEQYEISNYAKNGYECRHNIGYWKRTEYLGLGLGAASLVDEELWKCLCGEETSGSSEREGMDGTEYCSLEQREYRFCNTRNLQEYLENSRKPRIIRRDVAALSEKEQQEEFMFLGLRMTKGISVQEFRGRFGKEIEEIYGQVLKKYEAMGFLEESGGFWRFTRKGIHVSNHILSDFLQD